MSRIIRKNYKCYVCKSEKTYRFLCSSSSFGSPDLDLRPSPLYRNTMAVWAHECPCCGYVTESGNIDKKTTITRDFLNSSEYQTCNGIDFPSRLAVRFYKQYLINIHLGKKSDAFYALLHAAWACDDINDKCNAVKCRRLSLPLLSDTIKSSNTDKEELILMKADIMRRAKLFDDVVSQYSSVTFSNELLNKIIKFQVEMAKDKDDSCYSVDYVVDKE